MNFLLILTCIVFLLQSMNKLCDSSCHRPKSPSNGRVWFRVQGGITAIYTCDVGYVLKGTNVSQCQTDSQWSSPPPKCHLPTSLCSNNSPEVFFQTLRLLAGSATVIDCDDGKAKNVTRIWLKDGHPIKAGVIPGVTLLDNSSILVHSGSHENEGIYLCLSQKENTVKINKAVKLIVDLNKHSLSLGYLNDCNLKVKNPTKIVYGTIGNPVFLRCDIENSSVLVEWYKDNKLLRYVDSYQYLPDGTLYIENLRSTDAGLYVCTIQSSLACNTSKTIEIKLISTQNSHETYSCGKPHKNHRVKRIIDGAHAENNTHPWMCMLSTHKIAVVCGCSLISNQWVITAAHCVSDEKVRRYFVKLGKRQRGQVEKQEVVASVLEVVVHPQYQKRSEDGQGNYVNNENDIALLKLETPVVFRHNVLPICLPSRGFMKTLPAHALGTVTGWGRVSIKGSVMAVILQEASLPIIPTDICKRSSSYVLTDNMFCAGYAESYKPDTCYGDSGGPLTVQKEGIWYLVGIISWGEGCSTPRKYGIYTKVENYFDWIESVMNKVE